MEDIAPKLSIKFDCSFLSIDSFFMIVLIAVVVASPSYIVSSQIALNCSMLSLLISLKALNASN